MARQKGSLKIEGMIDDLVFYKRDGGYFVRRKTSVNKQRILTDPAFENTRSELNEFGEASSCSKLIRQAFIRQMRSCREATTWSRLMGLMRGVVKEDTYNAKGKRTVAAGIGTANGKDLVRGFNFNEQASINAILRADYELNTSAGILTIPDFLASRDLQVPEGATGVFMMLAASCIDFGGKRFETTSGVLTMALNSGASTVNIALSSMPSGSGTTVFVLQIGFLQLVNGVEYPMENGLCNGAAVLELI